MHDKAVGVLWNFPNLFMPFKRIRFVFASNLVLIEKSTFEFFISGRTQRQENFCFSL